MSAGATIPACFAPDYCVPTRSRSMEKLGVVATEVRSHGNARIVDPGVLAVERLFALHDPDYVRAFLDGTPPLATSQNMPWSPALRRAVLAMQAGQLAAAGLALEHGVAGHIANGFHHARYRKGGGFCTFNGLALVALAHPDRRVFVLDCDEHGGNGTEEFAARLPNLFNYSVFGTPFGCVGGPRSVAHRVPRLGGDFAPYAEALDRAFAAAEAWQPDLVVFQAGADCHVDDPMGSIGLTTAQLAERDRRVFAFFAERGMPVLFTLAGSYQRLAATARLHLNTFLAASAVHGVRPSAA